MERRRPILVVEDDPKLREAMTRILRSEGHDVLEAGDAEIALALGREHAPSLMVIDDGLPSVDGVRLLSRLRDALHEGSPPAVFLTSSRDETTRVLALGAKASLQKPFQVEDLLRAVELHRRRSGPDA
jgi:DNA-binding response OmpR family regulator